MEIQPDLERLHWIATYLRIITKAGTCPLLNPNPAQMRLHLCMESQRQRNLPVRILLCKSRQLGCSTWVEAEGFYEVYHRPNWRAMAVSVDAVSTDHIFNMTKLFEDHLPPHLKRLKDNTNRKEVVFSAPHHSRFVSQTAGKMSLGRSFTAQYLHSTEVAFWENAAVQMSGLEDIVPVQSGTTIVQETTANGQGGYFYEAFVEAVKKARRHPDDYTGYQAVFFPWFIDPENRVEPPAGTVFSREDRALQERFHLVEPQLYWRRLKLESKNGDLSLLLAEHPSTWEESFQVSGNPVFSPAIVARQALYQQERFRGGLFEEGSGQVQFLPTDEMLNVWRIWCGPKDEHDYALGIDTMEGRVSDVRNPRSALDYHGMVMLDRSTGEVVAVYHGRGDQRALAEQAFRAARYYNESYVAPEIPQSMILLDYFKERGYAYLYNRQRHEDRETETESEVLGWRTTAITRKWLVDDFVVALKEASVKLIFPDLLDEVRSFVRDVNGRPEHLPGEHDDLLFAAMIALQAHKRCPLTTRPYRQSRTGELPAREDGDDDLARVGAIDKWDPADEEEQADDDLYTD